MDRRGEMKTVAFLFAVLVTMSVPDTSRAESMEVMLASIDAGRAVAANSPQAARTREAIKKLMAACPREKKDLPDRLAKVTKQELTDKGRFTTATEVFEGIQAIVINYEGEDCTSVFALYVNSRMNTGF